MKPRLRIWPYLLAVVLASLALFSPAAANAQEIIRSTAPQTAPNMQTIRGRIRSIDDGFRFSILDERGGVDVVQPQPGTVVRPSGLKLAVGMPVTVSGYNTGSSFYADRIDAAYAYTGAYPSPVYYGPGYWYPGFGYGYGPSFSLGLVPVNGGYAYVRQPFYGRPYYWRPYYWRPYYAQPYHGYYGRPYVMRPYYGPYSAYYGQTYYAHPYYGPFYGRAIYGSALRARGFRSFSPHR